MISHRLKTLGHIVATTRIGLSRLFVRRIKFDADEFLATRGIEMMKEWQSNYQVDYCIGLVPAGKQL